MNPVDSALIFLIQIFASFYLVILMLRIILQKSGVSFYNPIVQFIIKITNPPLMVLRKILPNYSKVDLSVVLLIILVELIKVILLSWLSNGMIPAVISILVLMLADLLHLLIEIYFYGILFAAILSFFRLLGLNPLLDALQLMTNPVLRQIRRYIKPIAGLDFSPFTALIALHLIDILLVGKLISFA